jgi:hypothetical protein
MTANGEAFTRLEVPLLADYGPMPGVDPLPPVASVCFQVLEPRDTPIVFTSFFHGKCSLKDIESGA